MSALAVTRREIVGEEAQEASPETIPMKRTSYGKRTLSQTEVTENALLQNISDNITKKMSVDEDADRSFLLSMLQDFRKIHDDLKIDAKTEMLNVIKKYKPTTHSSHYYANQPLTGYYNEPVPSTSTFQRGYNVPQCSPPIQQYQSKQVVQREYSAARSFTATTSTTPSPAVSDSVSINSEQESIIEDMFLEST